MSQACAVRTWQDRTRSISSAWWRASSGCIRRRCGSTSVSASCSRRERSAACACTRAKRSRGCGSSSTSWTSCGINLAGVQRLLSVADVVQRMRELAREEAVERAEARRRLARDLDQLERDSGAVTMEFKDYYATLGVSKTATDKEIKQAFRKLARKYHPDVNPGDKAAEARFKEINEAHEVLSDADKRRKYDELGANWRAYEQAAQGGGANPFGGWTVNMGGGPGGYRTMTEDEVREMFGSDNPFSDFFKTFFGGAEPETGRRGRPRQGPRPQRARRRGDTRADARRGVPRRDPAVLDQTRWACAHRGCAHSRRRRRRIACARGGRRRAGRRRRSAISICASGCSRIRSFSARARTVRHGSRRR